MCALQEAHEAGICHRDLKPLNLYLETVNGEDFLKVLDFGIAKIADTKQTTSGVIMGTPSYMSPEQIQAQGVDRRTDLYSLGVIAYEAMTGSAPFHGDTPVSVMYKHANQHAPDVRLIRPDIHPAMAHLVGALLEKDPGIARPESAGAVVQFINLIDWSSLDAATRTVEYRTGNSPRIQCTISRWLSERTCTGTARLKALRVYPGRLNDKYGRV